MSKQEAREAQRKLREINRRGAVISLQDERSTLEFLADSIYVLSAEGAEWCLLWVGAGADFVLHADEPGGSTHDWPLRRVRITESARDKYDGEQIRELSGVRHGGPDDVDLEMVTVRIADPALVGQERYNEMQRWRRHRAGKREYYEQGLRDIIERARLFHPEFDYEYIMG